MKRLNWWTTIVLLLISQTYAASVDVKTQESDLKSDGKELLKAAASSAEYSASLASDYANEKQQDNVAASSSAVSSVDQSGNYNTESQSQYSQPLSYSQPGTPVQPIHSYSQPLNYAPQALPYTSENQQYGSADTNGNQANQYPSIKDIATPEVPSANSQYYPQYPAPQQYNPHLVLQQQASAQMSDYHSGSQVESAQQQYDSPNQATYVQPAQHSQVYLHHQHHVSIPGSSYNEQTYVVEGDRNSASVPYTQASYSQPLPPEYSQEYSHGGNSHQNSAKPKKTVILAIPVKLVAKNKYGQNNNGGYSSQAEVQTHYSSNVVPAAANLPVAHSVDKNNYYSNEQEKPSFNEKPLYADKPSYTDKSVEDYPKVNHNLNNNLQNNGYNGEYEPENGDHYRPNHAPRYQQHKPSGSIYNAGREVKPLSNYQTGRSRKPSNYGPEIYSSNNNNGPEYTTNNGGATIEEEISYGPEHSSYPAEIEHNHIHSLPPMHKHKLNDVYNEPIDIPPPYIPSSYLPNDFPSLGGPLTGISSYANPMDLIYSSPYKLGGPSMGYGGKPGPYHGRPMLGSASSPSQSTSSQSNYGQFLSSLLSAYSLGGLKPSSKPSSSSSKGGLASYLNLPGIPDLLKGYSSLSPSYSGSLLTSASGLNKYYYMPNPNQKPSSKPANYLGWPSSDLTQQAKPKPSGLLASSSNIVSSIDELFKSSLNPSTSKFKRPLYSDATRAITNFYKKFLN